MTEKRFKNVTSFIEARNSSAPLLMRAAKINPEAKNYILVKRSDEVLERFLKEKNAIKQDNNTVKIGLTIWHIIDIKDKNLRQLRPTNLIIDNRISNLEFNILIYPFVCAKCKNVELFD